MKDFVYWLLGLFCLWLFAAPLGVAEASTVSTAATTLAHQTQRPMWRINATTDDLLRKRKPRPLRRKMVLIPEITIQESDAGAGTSANNDIPPQLFDGHSLRQLTTLSAASLRAGRRWSSQLQHWLAPPAAPDSPPPQRG